MRPDYDSRPTNFFVLSSHINYGLECLKAYSEVMCSADDKAKQVKTKLHNNLAPFEQLYAEKCGKNFIPPDMKSECTSHGVESFE